MININLLPEKEKRSRVHIFVLLGLSVGFVISLSILVVFIMLTRAEVGQVERQIQTVKQQYEELENKLTVVRENDIELLEAQVQWIEKLDLPTSTALVHYTRLLPERGFFRGFKLDDSGQIELVLTFDTILQSSDYLRLLDNSSITALAKIKDLDTNDLLEHEIKVEDGLIVISEGEPAKHLLPRYLLSYEIKLNEGALIEEAEKLKQERIEEEEENE